MASGITNMDRFLGARPVFVLICIDAGLIITSWLEDQNAYQFTVHLRRRGTVS